MRRSLAVCRTGDFRKPTEAIPELPRPPETPGRLGIPEVPEALSALKGSEAVKGGVGLGLETEEGV